MARIWKFVKKNMLFILVISLIAGLILQLSQSFADNVASDVAVENKSVIIIDAGHGGFDPGAVAKDGTLEKDINLEIALVLADIFRANGYTVVLTRETDIATNDEGLSSIASKKTSDIHNRCDLANGYMDAIFISIHLNAYSDKSQHGTQVFYGRQDANSEIFAECVREMVAMHLQLENKRETKRGNDNLYLLKNVTCPAIMVECGFMTNDFELSQLKDPVYQQQIAFCIYLGYCEYSNS